jgi:hypothetical protein
MPHHVARSARFPAHLPILRLILNGRDYASAVGMENIKSFRDLLVWQKSMNLAVSCYKLAQRLPKAD